MPHVSVSVFVFKNRLFIESTQHWIVKPPSNSLRMAWKRKQEYWHEMIKRKKAPLQTTRSSKVIKWIRNNQFCLFIDKFFPPLVFLRQKMCLKLYIAEAIKHDIKLVLCIHQIMGYIMYRRVWNVGKKYQQQDYTHAIFHSRVKKRVRERSDLMGLEKKRKPVLLEIDKFLVVFGKRRQDESLQENVAVVVHEKRCWGRFGMSLLLLAFVSGKTEIEIVPFI